MSSPPFGSAEYFTRTPLYLKQGYKRIEVFSSCSVYSNRTATRQQHCTSLISRRRDLFPCRTATMAQASSGLIPAYGQGKQHKITPFHSSTCVKRIMCTHQPISGVRFSLGMAHLALPSSDSLLNNTTKHPNRKAELSGEKVQLLL